MKFLGSLLLVFVLFLPSCSVDVPHLIYSQKGIDEIRIYSFDEGLLKVISDESDIEYFISAFKPTQSISSNKLLRTNFHSDGYIELIRSNKVSLHIVFDMGQGYRLEVNSKEFYERFTYRTGRYLSELDK